MTAEQTLNQVGGSVSAAAEVDKQAQPLGRFRPLPLVRSSHFQTVAAILLPGGSRPNRSEHRLVQLPDGDRLVIVLSTPQNWQPDQRTIVLVHGLCGCCESPYMRRIAGRLYDRGFRAVRVNLRGCGSGAGLARWPYHSGRSEDIRHVVQWLNSTAPDSPVTVVGFSLGGNIVLKMAGEDGDSPTGRLDSVAGISAPIDLVACSKLIEHPKNWFYDRYFVRRLLGDVRDRQRYFPDLPPLELPSRITLRQFDNLYTAPRSGFRDANDYYTRASSAPLIDRIAIRTLLLSSRDDPFIAPEPFERLRPRASLECHLTDGGGHLGFLGFTGQSLDFRWMDELIVRWIARL